MSNCYTSNMWKCKYVSYTNIQLLEKNGLLSTSALLNAVHTSYPQILYSGIHSLVKPYWSPRAGLTVLPWSFVDVHAVTQSCLTLRNPLDCSPSGFSVLGIFQTRILEWASISSSRGFSWSRNQTRVSFVSCIASGFFTCWAIRESLMDMHRVTESLGHPTRMF